MMINSRDPNLLKPYVKYQHDRLVEECRKQGIEILTTSTLRDAEYQRYLYEKVKGSTNTPLSGPHGFGLAFDVVPLVNGKAIWNNQGLWAKIGAIGMALGLEWGGTWKSFVDKPHFQYTQGLSSAQLRKGMLPKFPPIPTGIIPFRARGMLKNTTTLECCSKPSNSARTGHILRKGINEPINIFAKCMNEGIEWYLVNQVNEQWVAGKYVQLI